MSLPLFPEPTPDFLDPIPCPSGCEPQPPSVRVVGPHIGAYCGSCDKWLKWLPQTTQLREWLNDCDS